MRRTAHSLNTKFALGTAAGLVASSLVFLVLFVGLYRDQIARERTNANVQVTRLLQISLENAMLKRDLDGLQHIVARLGEQPGIHGAMIATTQGLIRVATDPASVGKQLALGPGPLNGMVTEIITAADGRPLVRSINPVPNRDACRECHGSASDRPINGFLLVDLDAEVIGAQARSTTLLLMGAGALIVLLNLAGGWWFMGRFVLRPVHQLTAVSARLAGGDLAARATLAEGDELASLGEGFNAMADSLQGKIRDIEQKERFLQQLIDAVPDGIRVIDQDFRVVLANATYRNQLGLALDSPAPTLCHAATHAREAPCAETLVTCPVREIARTGTPLRTIHQHTRSDGSKLGVELYAAPMRIAREGHDELLVVESIRDLEQEVRFSHEQHLSELGRLAAGVAHEIHNPLSSVRLALNAAERAAAETPPNRERLTEYLTLVDQEVVKCSQVTERLLHLSVPPSPVQELVEVDRVVAETLSLLAWEAESCKVGIRLVADQPTPLRVLATDSEIRMMALNLAQNACHAMPDGGELAVRFTRASGEVVIGFEDTGVGIDARDQVRIFEPFFSCRADGSAGTGLGLPITKSLVESHGGTIRIDSGLGRGCRVTVTFPDADLEPGESP
ncbi:MAG: HAMP domain-containing protein [Thiocapsa sp.]|uniref:sensor histidine kinase n=1 Tax=Thiocapsa sp. TaxID=2024551 RepID=UPI001BCB2A9D|nr:ATP-binding protein [Thiocapsa sp.]QVL49919.1 MAG: HAMP domain-containing protein [Thiocapsa sp.]